MKELFSIWFDFLFVPETCRSKDWGEGQRRTSPRKTGDYHNRQWNKFCMKKVIKIFSYGSKVHTRFAEYGANTPQLKLKDPLISKS